MAKSSARARRTAASEDTAPITPPVKARGPATEVAASEEPDREAAFFEDATIRSVQGRALAYLRAGAPVHFRGPAGAGKTTLARRVAARLGRPILHVTGDGWLTSAHLIGDSTGERIRSVSDQYIHRVKKQETETTELWEDRNLTLAMEQGCTLVYDEFTRSPPEANNPLLAALEERVMILPTGARGEQVIKAHPDFRAIFTSNPTDYAAVTQPQDALLDRMITFDLSWHGAETEAGIVAARTGLGPNEAAPIVALIRALRADPTVENPPSLRTAIMIARIAVAEGLTPVASDGRFVQLCFDVLESRAPGKEAPEGARYAFFEMLDAQIRSCCAEPSAAPSQEAAA